MAEPLLPTGLLICTRLAVKQGQAGFNRSHRRATAVDAPLQKVCITMRKYRNCQ